MQNSPLTEPTVDAVMSAPVQTLPADTKAADALDRAAALGIHHFPLVRAGALEGLVCTCDLEELELEEPVGAALRRGPVTLAKGASLLEAARLMGNELVGSVLVVDPKHPAEPAGIVTREDLCRAGLKELDVPNFRCASCGAVTHLRDSGRKGVLCLDCRSRSGPESRPGEAVIDETGVGD